jgi:hypothetical protein
VSMSVPYIKPCFCADQRAHASSLVFSCVSVLLIMSCFARTTMLFVLNNYGLRSRLSRKAFKRRFVLSVASRSPRSEAAQNSLEFIEPKVFPLESA